MSEIKINVMSNDESYDVVTKCTICSQTDRAPKVLSCLHTFCENCFQTFVLKLKKSDGYEIPCPICRREFLVPDCGLDIQQNNHTMKRLIDTRSNCNGIKPSSIAVACDSCREDSSLDKTELPNAEVYCRECDQNFCKECHKYHQKIKLSKNHTIVDLGSKQNSSVDKGISELCSVHSIKPLNIFCLTCSKAVCSMCFNGNHRSHDGASVIAVISDFQKNIQDDIFKLTELMPQLYQKRMKLEEDSAKFNDQVNDLEVEIIQSREVLKGLLEAHSQSLLMHLKNQQESSLNSMETSVKNIEFLMTNVENFKTYCSQLLNIGTSRNICEAMGLLKNGAMELQQKCHSEIENGFEFRNICLRHRIAQETLDSPEANLIGKLEEFSVTESDASNVDSDDECSTPDNTEIDGERFVPKESMYEVLEVLKETKENNMSLKNRIEELEGIELELAERVKALQKGVGPTAQRCSDSCYVKEEAEGVETEIGGSCVFHYGGYTDDQHHGSNNCKNGVNSVIHFNSVSKSSLVWTVEALAILMNEFFIVVKTEDIAVEIYDLASLTFKRIWRNSLERLSAVRDIKSCENSRCLYVMNVSVNGQSNEIIKYDPQGVLLSFWSVGSSFGQLSVSDDSTVLFTSWNKNEIVEYRSDGQRIRIIPLLLEHGFLYPFHALKLNSDIIVVSHGTSGQPKPRVCITDLDGRALTSTSKITRPVYMDKDRYNNIVVVDRGQCCIKVFDSNLDTIANRYYWLRSETSLHNLEKAIIDESNNRIFVVASPRRKPSKFTGERSYQDVLAVLPICRK